MGNTTIPPHFLCLKTCLFDLNCDFCFYGFKMNSRIILALFHDQCADCILLLSNLGKKFYVEKILLDPYLPLLDKKEWTQPCCELMLLFCTIFNLYGKLTVSKCCQFIIHNWQELGGLRFWGCRMALGHGNIASIEYYFRKAMNIGYVQTITQWAESDL